MLTIDAVHLREINLPLAHPFETSFGTTTGRRILLVEIESDGLTAWGECVAGEHPYYSDESVDTAWIISETELAPRLVGAEVVGGGSCPALFRQVRGHRMAKAALENAVWDLEAQKKRASHRLELLGGTRSVIPCGVSIGIQPSPAALMDKIAEALEAGYQRIKLKCKPGWDTKIFEQVRKRWPNIMLSCDANSAYRVVDIEHIAEWDQFNLVDDRAATLAMDDFYFPLDAAEVAWDTGDLAPTSRSAPGDATRWRRSTWNRVASSTSRRVMRRRFSRRSLCTMRTAEQWRSRAGGGMLETGIGWSVHKYRAVVPAELLAAGGKCRRRSATGPRTSSNRRCGGQSAKGEITRLCVAIGTEATKYRRDRIEARFARASADRAQPLRGVMACGKATLPASGAKVSTSPPASSALRSGSPARRNGREQGRPRSPSARQRHGRSSWPVALWLLAYSV